MGNERAIDWLDRDPAEAADFLARTAVASRRVGGFIKRAAPEWQQWLNDLGQNQDVRNAMIGAGVGGLGGLGVGLVNRRKKNPLTTALTGAALGGLGTGAGSYLYNHPDFWQTSARGLGAAANLEKLKARAFSAASYPRQMAAKYLDWDVPMPDTPQPATPGEPATLAEAKEKLNPVVGALGSGSGALLGNRWDERVGAGVGGSLGAGAGRLAQTRWDDFSRARRAAQAFEKGMAGLDLKTLDPNRPDVGPGLQALRERGQVARGGARTGLFGDIAAARREAAVGRGLINLEALGGTIPNVIGNPALHGAPLRTPNLRSSDIGDVFARGEFQRNMPRGPLRASLPTLGGAAAGVVGGRIGENLARNYFGW
jgi:hypothetical protein